MLLQYGMQPRVIELCIQMDKVARDSKASGTVNLTNGDCYVGKAWNDDRWLDGEISELRVWSIQRTPEQIASSMYDVDHQQKD